MKQYNIKVLEKALKILDLFSQKGKELSATQIHQLLNLNKSTVFRILRILEESNYLERSPKSLKYRLGFKLYHLGSLVEGFTEIQKMAHPLLDEMLQKCDETVHFAILSHGEALFLDKIEGKKALRVVSHIGMTRPAHCSGVGKAMLAFLPDRDLEKIVEERGLGRITNNTITDKKILRAELVRVRRQGYAIDNEETLVGARCVAAAIRDSNGVVVAAISISAPKERLNQGEMRRMIPLVKETAEKISTVLREKGFTKEALYH